MGINGFLNVNKPENKTSSFVVTQLKHFTGEKRVGHAGTLDPIATGVLPVCLGQATRIVQFLVDSSKTYLAQIELGIATETFDKEGEITFRQDPTGITQKQIEEALTNFHGVVEQVPPKYSALKYKGKRYYELARAGIPIELKPRQVNIINIELVSFEPPFVTLTIKCGKGTYIRSLAHDLGQYLGCGAYLRNLTRTQYGPFDIATAISITRIEDAIKQNTLNELIHSVDIPLLNWNAVTISKDDESAVKNGCSIHLNKDGSISGEYCRAYDTEGHFIAVLRFIPEQKLWHPDKVFSL